MALDREYIKSKVKQAIEQLPSTSMVIREVMNKYNEKAGYCKVAEMIGVLYSNTTSRTFGINIDTAGVDIATNNKNYLVVYDDNSKNIKATDIIFIDDKLYKVNNTGENLEIYCLMQLENFEGLKIEGDTVIEDDLIYPLLDLPLDLNLRLG